MNHEINAPDILAEVNDAFERYNAALDRGDVEALNSLFWSSAHTVRFGPTENLFGWEQITSYRKGAWQQGAPKHVKHLSVTTIGRDFATTSAVFEREGESGDLRQSQTWVRFPDGWRIIAAHVSVLRR